MPSGRPMIIPARESCCGGPDCGPPGGGPPGGGPPGDGPAIGGTAIGGSDCEEPDRGPCGGMPPAEFAKFVRAEIERWSKVAKASGAKVEN